MSERLHDTNTAHTVYNTTHNNWTAMIFLAPAPPKMTRRPCVELLGHATFRMAQANALHP
jgi:hypothetical protein